MRHTLPIAPQFFVTAPQPCPYLPNRMERKLFTSLQVENADGVSDMLSKQGFRRSQNVLYRPACASCNACMSARIKVSHFIPSRSQKRVLRKNRPITRHSTATWATEEQFNLFRSYLDHRHADGGMANMDIFEFAAMIEETPITSRVIEYHDPTKASQSDLIGVCLTDVFDDGVSMVYSFFDTDYEGQSLGTYMILDHIRIAQEIGLPYVYLGYWVPGSEKMDYKARFSGVEVYRNGAWEQLNINSDFNSDLHPLEVQPIVEQVSDLKLPNSIK